MENRAPRSGNRLGNRLVRTLRRFIPSVPPLTYLWPVKLALNATDLPLRWIFPEMRALPPNHLRVRIGVGWRFANNQINHLNHAESFWFFALSQGLIDFHSNILDLGVGCGRFAHHLRDYRFLGHRFTGTYAGVDIDGEMLDWCRANFPEPNFRFHRSSHGSQAYENDVGKAGYYAIPEAGGSFDFVFSASLFTHLLEGEIENYLLESLRLLKPGRWMAAYCFCLDHPPPTLNGRHSFSHRIGNAYVESLSCPEAAVAYRQDFLFESALKAGFEAPAMLTGQDSWQAMLLCRKPDVQAPDGTGTAGATP